MSIQNVLNAGVYSKLQGTSGLTSLLSGTTAIYWMQAPDNATKPFVVFSHQAGGVENLTPSDMRNVVYFVRGYADTPALAGSIDAQISTALHGQTLTVSGYTNFWTVREEAVQLVENPPDKEKVFMSGAMYRIRLDS